ncbi:DUF2927 domain-containing protein [Pseudooceanicola sp. CBS1P-1]|uniref:DUF2927 domain-containing protein n=1 Tax=Pseudooceanicola albus TaxID=2692189 RepID=A0A6L7FYS7_9RHOB|nr:DUF2927 domain-containing protein [Pseudooceanicola endophyticus]MXN16921.1 DUF2927 domain-containing protein [Pseudooceanicola albus]
MPPMQLFGAVSPVAPKISNIDLARDVLDLTMQLESGRTLPRFTRFEGPIRISLKGPEPPTLRHDLAQVIDRLRREAGLDIALQPDGQIGNIVIQTVPEAEIRRQLPGAACFVVPGIADLSQYRAAQRQGLTDWASLDERRNLAIIVPANQPPQELRDCLNEELAQSLGPLDDLYRLPDSTFNDDNIHSILTGFDMLVLRVTYAPELHSGMTRDEVGAALPAILSRLNPEGDRLPARNTPASPPEWRAAISEALAEGSSSSGRRRAAQRAVEIAEAAGWQDTRMAFAYFTRARLEQDRDPEGALRDLSRAHRLYASLPDTRLHEATTATQLAVFALASGDPEAALALLKGRDAVALRYQNAALLSSVLMLQGRAEILLGRTDAGKALIRKSLGWGLYGFGSAEAVQAQLTQVEGMGQGLEDSAAALAPDTVTTAQAVPAALPTGPAPG